MTYFILTIILYLLYLSLRVRGSLHMLQQNSYNRENRFFTWITKNLTNIFFTEDILILFVPVLMIIKENSIIYILVAIIYLFLFIKTNIKRKKEQNKKPLVFTARMKRLIITYTIISAIIILLMIINFSNRYLVSYYLVLSLYAYLTYFVIYIVNFVNMPIEKIVYIYFFNKTAKKRNSMPNLKVIGVTGSYGKTSSKNVLATILTEKYRVLASPHSYNTAYGLMRTINENLTKFDEIFVAEVAAVRNHEIRETVKIIKPNYAIITRIGIAHLETFKTEENILNTKFELVEALDKDGIAILNKDDPKQVSYNIKSPCHKIWIGIDNKDADVVGENISYDHNGSNFDVIFKGDKKKYHFETNLLGYANVYNILAGIALAKEFGLSTKELQTGVKKIKQFEHRLQLKTVGDINIIDDAFNSNPIGSKMALDVLKIMPGKRIVVTPGMIELKNLEDEKNYEFGFHMANCVDIVILVGEKKTKPIYNGLIENKFDKKKIYVINDVKEAFPLINKLKEKDTYVLLENDLPDLFNEK